MQNTNTITIDPLDMNTQLLSTFYFKGLNMGTYIQEPLKVRVPASNERAKLRLRKYHERLAKFYNHNQK